MAKKKQSGKHAAPRQPVQLPAAWYEVGMKLAGSRPTPLMWLLVELLKKYAKEQGVENLPPTPWERRGPPAPG